MESKALDSFFGAHPELTAPPEEAAPAPVDPAAPAEPVAEKPPEPEAPKVSLAEEIRRAREAREARTAREADVASWKERAEKAEDRLSKRSKLDVLADTEAWVEEHEMTPEEISVLGRRLLYLLVPDKAPDSFRYDLMETRAARRERLAEAKRAKEASEAEMSRGRQIEESYVAALAATIEQPETAGTAPFSSAWFGDDREAWAASLRATAFNLAEKARAEGTKPNLDPREVTKVLEADIAARYGRAPGKAVPTPTEPKVAQPTPGAPKQAPVTTSTKGLTAAPAPRQKPKTEAEALEAAKALIATL